MSPPARAEAPAQLVFGPLAVRLDRTWQEVFGAPGVALPPGVEATLLEHGPLGTFALELAVEGSRPLRIEALGPRVVRASGPVGMEQLRAALRWTLVRALGPLGGFLVHAAAIEVEGEAHLFFGPPEAGKTTLANNAGERALTEESAVVFPRDGGWWLCGTPWWSDGGRPGRSEVLPLRRIAYLEKAPVTAFEARPASEVLALLTEQIYTAPASEAALATGLGASLLGLLSGVEHGRLRFTRDAVYAG